MPYYTVQVTFVVRAEDEDTAQEIANERVAQGLDDYILDVVQKEEE